jgi:ABC-type sugar transport system permease subunit/ribosomal protein S27AE
MGTDRHQNTAASRTFPPGCRPLVLLVCLAGIAVTPAATAGNAAAPLATPDGERIYRIVIHDLPASYSPLYPPFRAWFEHHPRVRPASYSRLHLSTLERGSLMMAIAGGSAPDLLRVYHHEARAWIRNGFFEPLDRYIYRDTDGDGRYTDGVDEVIWKPFLNISPRVRQFMMNDGHIYILPRMQWIQCLIYRKDIFSEAGIDPEKRIETFDDLLRVCRKITDPNARIPGARHPKGRHGFGLYPNGWIWQGWLYAAGGSSMRTHKVCPDCGAETIFKQDATSWSCSQCGRDLKDVPGRERAQLNTPEAKRALQLWLDMARAPFIKCPHCAEPIELGNAQTVLQYPIETKCPFCDQAVTVVSPRKVTFGDRTVVAEDGKADLVIEGCARNCVDEDRNWRELWINGEVAVTNYYKVDWLVESNVDPTVVGLMPYPEKGGASAYHYYGIYSGARKRTGGQDRVDVCANMILDFSSQFYVPKDDPDYLKYERAYTRRLVNYGYYGLCWYDELVAAGLEEYAREIPPTSRELQRMIRDPDYYKYLPISEGYSRVQQAILSHVLLSRLLTDPDYDIDENLELANRLADTQVFMKEELVEEKKRQYRLPVFAALGAFVLIAIFLFVRFVFKGATSDARPLLRRVTPGKRLASVIMLMPAVSMILLWAYYPLGRGSVMAFQNVEVLGESEYVGIENFVRVLTNPLLPTVLKATLIYVTALLSLGFVAPICLAILLSEIRRGSTMFRAIYYAPHLLGGVVVLFIWKIFYMPTSEGMLNQLIAVFGFEPVRWLEDPAINKWALAIPGIWAGSGSACLVYLAALKSIDDEVYEAAEIDGAGVWAKIRHITIPSLKPLLIINFVGAFIAAFHGMGNILVLTGGAFETKVIGLQIFFEAFGYLRFGSATALAWILGSLLIGFTVYQLNFLRRVEFRRAQ